MCSAISVSTFTEDHIEEITNPDIRQKARKGLPGYRSYRLLVCYGDEQEAAIAIVDILKAQRTYKIIVLFVQPQFRGKGIGKKLIENIESMVRERDSSSITINPFPCDPTQRGEFIAYLERRGYSREDQGAHLMSKSL